MIEYQSSDASAPTITGTAGSLISALSAILVDGYGSKAGSGWSKPYASGNAAVFRQGEGHRRYLWIDDSDARMARVAGYVTMTGVSAGEWKFPTESQFAGGLYCRKSITADSTARPWLCWADARTFYLIVFGALTSPAGTSGGDAHLAFGQTVDSPIPGDQYNTWIIGGTDTSTTSTTATSARQTITLLNNTPTATGHYMAGEYRQVPKSIQFGVRAPMNTSGSNGPYPDSDGNINIGRPRVYTEGASASFPVQDRGYMPGIWSICHQVAGNFTLLDTMTGCTGGGVDGRPFRIVVTANSGGCAFETADGSWNG